MKLLAAVVTGMAMFFMLAGAARAVDIRTLDRVSVHMPKSEVLAIIGKPEQIVDMGGGITAEIYPVSDMKPLMGVGCVYEDDRRLVSLAYIFQGEVEKEVAQDLKKLGFTALGEESASSVRLLGKDDDTGEPIVVYVSAAHGNTEVVTVEKLFYDRRVH